MKQSAFGKRGKGRAVGKKGSAPDKRECIWQERGRASGQRESAARAFRKRGKERMDGKKREGHLVRGKVLHVHLAGGGKSICLARKGKGIW